MSMQLQYEDTIWYSKFTYTSHCELYKKSSKYDMFYKNYIIT